MSAPEPKESGARRLVSVVFSGVQDGVYVVLGVLLALTAAIMLVQGAVEIARSASTGLDLRAVVAVLDRILLALMVVELLYTVQVSFREHALVPEPFLLVALIAAVRRILVITAEFSAQDGSEERLFRHVMWELGLLTVLIVVLVASLVVLRRNAPEKMARSHHG
ncbi:MAG TPA: phosphate-starvation-inducible PsiE family protein [Anaeromyxobacter sp.]|nr:phosphate-starvation-inducible PsiE family protein [Anaeromyxobacter sp.]